MSEEVASRTRSKANPTTPLDKPKDPKPTLTQLQHVIRNLLGRKADNPIENACAIAHILHPHELLELPNKQLENLVWEVQGAGGGPPVFHKLPLGDLSVLQIFRAFAEHCHDKGHPIPWNKWNTISLKDFNIFRFDIYKPDAYGIKATLPTPETVTSAPTFSYDAVRDFKRSIKCDPAVFPVFKDESRWDEWDQITTAHARSQELEDVLNPNYSPSNMDEMRLFLEKQKYMYAVFA